jgi:hypothetical protein
MSQPISITSIVYNVPYAKQLGLKPYYYRYRSCKPNFPNRTQTSVTGFTPAEQYQKQKIIQNTVRVPGSLYTSNLGPLHVYVQPSKNNSGVCWNQMSDRPVPSVQKATIPTGQNNALNRRHTSVTSSKPGSQTPGGVGCDIKHNSYDRYLNRLKGKSYVRRESVPKQFGKPVKFNPAFPVYGGKTMKTNIVSGCNCPVSNTEQKNKIQDIKIYNNPLWQPYPSTHYGFQVGDEVYAIKDGDNYYSKAVVIEVIEEDVYKIQFEDESEQIMNGNELLVYYPCC